MKLLHLSDLHIGKRVLEFSMLEDQKYILAEIIDICRKESPDAVIIAGDVYDKPVPGADAVALFDSFITELSGICKNVFIISGNHDSGERLAFASKLIQSSGVYFSTVYSGNIEPVRICDKYGPVDFYLIPFVKPPMVRRFFENDDINSYNDAVKAIIGSITLDSRVRNVAIAHQFIFGAERSDSEEPTSVGGIEDVDASLFEKFDYTALGHIHRPQFVHSENIRYSGTPLKYSASEAGHTKSVCIVTLEEKGSVNIRMIPLSPLRDMRILRGSYEELMSPKSYSGTNTEDYIHIVLTNENEIPNALGKLRSVYPNIMSFKYDCLRFSYGSDADTISADPEMSPAELFAKLYESQNNAKMTAKQTKIIDEICEEIFTEGAFER